MTFFEFFTVKGVIFSIFWQFFIIALVILFLVGSKSTDPRPFGPEQGLALFLVSYDHTKEISVSAPQNFFVALGEI